MYWQFTPQTFRHNKRNVLIVLYEMVRFVENMLTSWYVLIIPLTPTQIQVMVVIMLYLCMCTFYFTLPQFSVNCNVACGFELVTFSQRYIIINSFLVTASYLCYCYNYYYYSSVVIVNIIYFHLYVFIVLLFSL